MANVIYDKTNRLPSAKDSLKRALLLTVWLKRQEAQVKQVEVMAAMAGDLVEAKGNSRVIKAFKGYLEAAYPFAAELRSEQDQKMVEAMRKEAARGVITFTPVSQKTSPLLTAARARRHEDTKPTLKTRNLK